MKKILLMRLVFSVGMLTLQLVPEAYAQSLPISMKSPRDFGMGASTVSIGNDEYAPFSNPAGLSGIKTPRSSKTIYSLSGLGLVVGGNNSGAGMYGLTSEGVSARINKVIRSSLSHANAPSIAEVQFYPAVTFGSKKSAVYLVGIMGRGEITALAPSVSALPGTVEVGSKNTVGIVLGVGAASQTGAYSYGFSVRPMRRYSYSDKNYDLENGSDSFKSSLKSKGNVTNGVAVDVGVQMTAADFWLPTFGLSVINLPLGCMSQYLNPHSGKNETVCGTKFSGVIRQATDTNQLDPTEIKLGMSLTPRIRALGGRINLRLSMEGSPLPVVIQNKHFGLTDVALAKVLKGGAELFFGNSRLEPQFALRGGSYHGATTFGASINLLGVSIDFASYGEDIDLTAKIKTERRYLIGLTSAW